MIEPLARGVDPSQLAFHSLVNMGARAPRIESPLAAALERLGVDLAGGEPFTTAEAKQFVALVKAAIEVFSAAAPTDQPGALLPTVHIAMRELERALTQLLTNHRDLTTSLAPILRELLLAVQDSENLPSGATTTTRPPVDRHRPISLDGPPPTLARLLSSLVKSIARLQVVLPVEPPAAPRATVKVLEALVEAIADLLILLPEGAAQTSLTRALREAVVLLHEALPAVPASPATASPAPEAAPTSATVALQSTVARVIALVHEVLQPPVGESVPPATLPAPATLAPDSTEAPVAMATNRAAAPVAPAPDPREKPVASAPDPRAAPAALATGRGTAPVVPMLPGSAPAEPVAAGPVPLAPTLVASLANVIAQIATLPSAVLDAAPLLTAALLKTQLEAATASMTPKTALAVPLNQLETLDAYRWGLLVALNYRPAVGRAARARIDSARPRCELCSRLLEQSQSGALVCPVC